MAKMGIANPRTATAAPRIFEGLLGLDDEVVEPLRCAAPPHPCRGWASPDVAADLLAWHRGRLRRRPRPPSTSRGSCASASGPGEYHGHHPDVIGVLHESVGLDEPPGPLPGRRRPARSASASRTSPSPTPRSPRAGRATATTAIPTRRRTRAAHFLQAAVRTATPTCYRRFSEMVPRRDPPQSSATCWRRFRRAVPWRSTRWSPSPRSPGASPPAR